MKKVIVVAALLAACPVWAQKSESDLKQRMEEVNARALSLRVKADSANVAKASAASESQLDHLDVALARDVSNLLGNVQSYVDQQNYDEAIRSLRRVILRAQSPDLKASLEALLASLEKERDARTKRLGEKLDAFTKKVAEVSWSAKKPEAMEMLLAETQDMRESFSNSYSAGMRRQQQRLGNIEQFVQRWSDYLDAVEQSDLRRALEIQRDIRNSSTYRAIVALFPAEEWKARQQALRAQGIQNFEKSLKTVPARLAQAKSAADIRAILADLDELQNTYSSDVIGNEGYQRLNEMREALRQWSYVVAMREKGNLRGALESLRNYENGSRFVDLVPQEMIASVRGTLLREFLSASPREPEKALREEVSVVIANVKSPDDISQLQAAVRKLRSAGLDFDNNTFYALDEDLVRLDRSAKQLEAKQYTAFWTGLGTANRVHPWSDSLNDLRRQLGLKALNEQIGLNVAGAKGSLVAIVSEQIKGVKAKGDWERALKLVAISRRLGDAPSGCSSQPDAEVEAIRSYLEGRNLEDAGQWAEAIKAYQNAVRQIGENVPRAEAKERLAMLAKTHPEASGSGSGAR